MAFAQPEEAPASSPEVPAESVAPSEPEASPALTESLTEEQMAGAVRVDSVTVPTPGELLAALTKTAKPDWHSGYREPIPTTYTSRPQLAFNLGGLIADGFLAVEGADSQRVKNMGKDIITLAKALGVSQDVLSRANSISDFAENNQWSTLKEELEATQNEVKIAMEEQGDQDLVVLVTIGGWVRGTEIVTGWIGKNYTPESSKLLRQPAVVSFMRTKITELPEKVQSDKLVAKVSDQLEEIETLVSFPVDTVPTVEDVEKIQTVSSKMVSEMVNKE